MAETDRSEGNWREGKTQQEKIKCALDNSFFTDCVFEVEYNGEIMEYDCHRFLFALASPVFEKLLFGPQASKNSVPVKDIPVGIFKDIISCVYSGMSTNFVNFLNEQNRIMWLHIAASKFEMKDLENACRDRLLKMLKPDNSCSIYQFAVMKREEELRNRSLKLIQLDTQNILHGQDFLRLRKRYLTILLSQDAFNIDSEKQLISAVIKWGVHNRKDTNIPLVDFLGTEILKHLCFSSLSIQDFCEVILPTELFTSEQKVSLMRYISTPLENLSTRVIPEFLVSCRLAPRSKVNDNKSADVVFSIMYGARMGNFKYKVVFYSSCDVFLVGLDFVEKKLMEQTFSYYSRTIFGCANFRLLLRNGDDEVKSTMVVETDINDPKDSTRSVVFPNQVTVRRHKIFTLLIEWSNKFRPYRKKSVKFRDKVAALIRTKPNVISDVPYPCKFIESFVYKLEFD